MELTCHDLAGLGFPCLFHDPREQAPGDPLCDCCSTPPRELGLREYGGVSYPSGPWEDVQECHQVSMIRSPSLTLVLCCTCLEAVWHELGRARKAADRAWASGDLATARGEEARYLRMNLIHRQATAALQGATDA
jgi:hypothetical protein